MWVLVILLVVTNAYRSGEYVDHEGKCRDVFDFGRKFFINQDTLFTVEGVEDVGAGRLVLSVSEYPSGVGHCVVLEAVVGYSRARVCVVGLGRSAVLALDTGDEAALTLGAGGEVSVWYDERECRLLSHLTVARGVSFVEANEYVVSKYQAESRREWLANLDGDRFVRELTSIGHPVPAELTEYLHQLRTVGDGVETAYKKARAVVLKQKAVKVKEVASVEVPQWRKMWNEYQALHADLQEALSQH